MKLVVIGNTSLISSAALEQHEHSVQLIVNTYQRWPHWHYVGTSIELDKQQPHLHQCGAFDSSQSVRTVKRTLATKPHL